MAADRTNCRRFRVRQSMSAHSRARRNRRGRPPRSRNATVADFSLLFSLVLVFGSIRLLPARSAQGGNFLVHETRSLPDLVANLIHPTLEAYDRELECIRRGMDRLQAYCRPQAG